MHFGGESCDGGIFDAGATYCDGSVLRRRCRSLNCLMSWRGQMGHKRGLFEAVQSQTAPRAPGRHVLGSFAAVPGSLATTYWPGCSVPARRRAPIELCQEYGQQGLLRASFLVAASTGMAIALNTRVSL